MSTLDCFSGECNPWLSFALINAEKNPDFLDEVEGPSHSDLRIFADATVEYPSLKKSTFFIPISLTSNQAFVTIDVDSSILELLYCTGAV